MRFILFDLVIQSLMPTSRMEEIGDQCLHTNIKGKDFYSRGTNKERSHDRYEKATFVLEFFKLKTISNEK